MLIDLADAEPATSGAKAAALARLLRAGLPVPPGFVVPAAAYAEAAAGLDPADAGGARRLIARAPVPPALAGAIARALGRLAGPAGEAPVAVRSSATTEDTATATAAGQHDTFLGVSGPERVADAVRACWASLWSERAADYRRRQAADGSGGPPVIAVLVQRLVDADVAGVMFTGTDVRIEASWGLGETVVSGRVTPDSWVVSGGAVVHRALGVKDTRLDREGAAVVTREVPPAGRTRFCLTGDEAVRLAELGRRAAGLLGGPQDVEWAISGGRIWILQARPVTSALPDAPSSRRAGGTPPTGTAPTGSVLTGTVLTGTPGGAGTATGPVRLVRGPGDFGRVRAGDVLVCRTTDPAWTPLFGVAAAVVTETGGLLAHAAIVARERGIPAVLAVRGAMETLPDGAEVQVNGSTGRITLI